MYGYVWNFCYLRSYSNFILDMERKWWYGTYGFSLKEFGVLCSFLHNVLDMDNFVDVYNNSLTLQFAYCYINCVTVVNAQGTLVYYIENKHYLILSYVYSSIY